MEKQFFITHNGQQVITSDLDIIGEGAGLADDRVLHELLRMPPAVGSVVSKGVLPGTHGTALVDANGATGSVLVQPFRAVIGARIAEATNPKESYRGSRSGIVVGNATTRAQAVVLSPNASGQPRWDLVYAVVQPDQNDAGTVIKRKDPSTHQILATLTPKTKSTLATLGVISGVPLALPSAPALPTDTTTEFYVPIAFVRVPNGFTSGSTVAKADIATVAPCLALATATGAGSFRVANAHNKVGGAMISSAAFGAWGASGAAKPVSWIPSNAVGENTIMVAANLGSGVETIASGGIIDDSRDWRNLICRWSAMVTSPGASFEFAYEAPGGGAFPTAAGYPADLASWVAVHGFGSTAAAPGSTGRVLKLDGDRMTFMTNGTFIYIDHDSQGRLVLTYTGSPGCRFLAFLTFVGPFDQAF
jgi:hypothetical protein